MKGNIFEQIKHKNEYGNEYWKARELAKVLEYKDFGNFENVINKAKESCKNSKQKVEDHFGDITEKVKMGLNTERSFQSYTLSRYACYLIIQNADPSKEAVALGQTYFAIQTRKQEINEQFLEDSKRKQLRDEMKKQNTILAETANNAGVTNYGIFTDYGYMGLYNGLKARDIHSKKGLQKSQKILDYMGSEELAANLFRATQTEAKIRRENIIGEQKANTTHYEVGKEVRDTIKKLGGTMPEELPTSDSIKEAEKRLKSVNKKPLKKG